MAEAFANRYGGDVLTASSAGLTPVEAVVRSTVKAMGEVDIDVSGHKPRLYNPREAAAWDVVVNMAGLNLPGPRPRELVEWQVNDPIGTSMESYRAVRNDLEQRVMRLILDLRRSPRKR